VPQTSKHQYKTSIATAQLRAKVLTSPFGSSLPNRAWSDVSRGYRYGFNNQEKDEELGEYFSFEFRIADSRLGRFLSVDPLFFKYPFNSSYAFCENRIIDGIDFEGLEFVSFHSNSFAPFDQFGGILCGSYKGDGNTRKFADGGSNRVSSSGDIDLSNFNGNKPLIKAQGSKSTFTSTCGVIPDRIEDSDAKIESLITASSSENQSSSFAYSLLGNNKTAPLGISCDIDVNVYFHWQIEEDNKIKVDGYVNGDRFPANETYIQDQSGIKIILGVSGVSSTNPQTAPYTELCHETVKNMSTFGMYIKFKEENEKKVFDKIIAIDGTEYTIENWNKQFTKLDPQSNIGTKTNGNGTVESTYGK
jgi:RHS repeat-associated protein